MGMFDIFKKKEVELNDQKLESNDEKFLYEGIEIIVDNDVADSNKHFAHDYGVLTKHGIDNIIKDKFIPWLLYDEFIDRDVEKVKDGLEVFEITYHYGRIVAQYSPTKKDDYFGQFEFLFRSCSEYTEDILEAVAMEIYIYGDEIIKVSGYDI